MALQEMAHTPASGGGDWHVLSDHLVAVAEMTSRFASAWGAGDLGYWLGYWHDLGKYHPHFQQYLHDAQRHPGRRMRGPDHKAAGAAQVLACGLPPALALIIQAHHGGLTSPAAWKTWFARMQQNGAIAVALERASRVLPQCDSAAPVLLPDGIEHDALATEFFTRMLFSALVDADFLDTERHFHPEQACDRRNEYDLAVFYDQLLASQALISGKEHTTIAVARHTMYQACLAAADHAPGFFRLAMPTGCGKTRSAMAFALKHALQHGLQRIIVAVPFTTVTEQTAAEYRAIFGDVVLEHHSATRDESMRAKLAAENWDAAIVVTTTVQLFESLFGQSTSTCRKVHRLARSVIILDEAQSLPATLLAPILDVLQMLCTSYRASVVLSTATQPAFDTIPAFKNMPAIDIIPDADLWFRRLQRVTYEWQIDVTQSWQSIAQVIRAQPQALAIVNAKSDALALLDALALPDTLYMSSALCGQHRREVLATAQLRLRLGLPCHVIATQVIEAGVDIDFPFVVRALAPLDSIIQAAGRCNRHATQPRGTVVVVRPEQDRSPSGTYHTATAITEMIIRNNDMTQPDVIANYFRLLFATVDTDRNRIQHMRREFEYRNVAEAFRMIPDDSEQVVVTYLSSDAHANAQMHMALSQLRAGQGNMRLLMRILQPYLVAVPRQSLPRYERTKMALRLPCGVAEWQGEYDPVRGLIF